MINIKERWDLHSSEPILGVEIGDVNNNGQSEIIAFSKSGRLLIISQSGKKITELEISENSSIWQAKICDIDRDNKNEVILGGLDGLLRTFKCNTSYELQPFWVHQFGASISGFLYADVNVDGIEEIIAYSIDKSIRCLNSFDGSLIWGQLFEDGIGDAILWQDPLNPLTLEVIACGNDGTIRSFKGSNGELIWFKRFKDKIRCVSGLKSGNKEMIVCGGDDKKLYVIDKNTHEDLKSFHFDDFVWKCASFTIGKKLNLFVSTYSFSFFDDSIEVQDIEFSSKILCLNSKLENKWEIENTNLECFIQAEIFSNKYFIIGTTKGNILILEAGSGEIFAEINKNSCVNDIKYDSESSILISCHDNGSIFAYFLGKS
jgi:outer membrane protein assembly factor BamB